jgi:uncharacterized repeat protein (TIGR01451 family)
MLTLARGSVTALLLSLCATAYSHGGTAPTLFTQPAYESPERGDPDDLLLVSGEGLSAADTVVYAALANTRIPPVHPATIPMMSTASAGVADLVSVADAPHSLTIHLPQAMAAGQSYALWVVGPGGRWSAPVRINDARPLWITTDSAYQSGALANLPRRLKVIGRNLQAASATGTTRVRLIGSRTGTTYTLAADHAGDSVSASAALARYVAAVSLPSPLVVDQYRVLLSRDDESWVPLLGNGVEPPQVFTVLPNPAAQRTFQVSDFAHAADSPCLPDDRIDDTKCILLAIRAAAAAPGGGTVVFGPGVWMMSDPGRWPSGSSYSNVLAPTCGVTYDGVLVPRGVNLQGSGSVEPAGTTIERGVDWVRKSTGGAYEGSLAGFALQGNNEVSGLIFKDANDYRSAAAGGPMLQLGVVWYRARLYSRVDPLTASHIVISKNVFDKPYVAIGNGALPMDHVFITYNTFGGAYNTAVRLEQDPNEVKNLLPAALMPYQTYRFDDAVVDFNTFYPSSWNYTPASGQYGEGTIASQISSGLRTDFSDNVADGASTRYLYAPTTDAKGWRAAYFWSTGANQEMTLVSNNSVTCPGDKNGDGEAFAFDGSITLGGVPAAQPVIVAAPQTPGKGSTGTTLTLRGSLVTVFTAAGHVDISTDPTPYYRGFWVQVVAGTGKGQWRKLESVALGHGSLPTVTMNVTPAFDVLPDATSQVSIGHAYWQNLTVNNTVDQRSPLCTKANIRSGGGSMLWYDSAADSAMEGNQLYDASGIFVRQNYAPVQLSAPVMPGSITVQSSNEIRDNLIDGVYGRSTRDSWGGGILLGYGAAERAPAPPDLGYGISIARNRILRADSRDPMNNSFWPRGAIALSRVWSTGPTDASGQSRWQLGDSTLIFHNALQNITAKIPGTAPFGVSRVGIGIDPLEHGAAYSMNAWRSALYANACDDVDIPVSDTGIGTVRYCPLPGADTCECRGLSDMNISVAASASESAVKVGDTVTYLVTVTNHADSSSANGVMLMFESAAGMQFSNGSVISGVGSCDMAANVCSLGIMGHGKSAGIRVTATALAAGTWDTTFSVTHREPEPNVASTGVIVSTVVDR